MIFFNSKNVKYLLLFDSRKRSSGKSHSRSTVFLLVDIKSKNSKVSFSKFVSNTCLCYILFYCRNAMYWCMIITSHADTPSPDIQSLLIITNEAADGTAEPDELTETLTKVVFTVLTATVTSKNIQR